jgi:hypothetical protein
MLMELSKKPISLVLLEAFVVGIILVIFYYIFDKYFSKYLSNQNKLYILLFISGFMFHIIFEYTGINLWYSKQYLNYM